MSISGELFLRGLGELRGEILLRPLRPLRETLFRVSFASSEIKVSGTINSHVVVTYREFFRLIH